MPRATIDDLKELSVGEKIDLVEELWNSIADDPGTIPLTQAQRVELDKRLETNRLDPDRGSSWEEVRSRIGPHTSL